MGAKCFFDKFYTKDIIVKELLKSIDFSDYDFIIEPSAGSGSFYNNLDKSKTIGLDLAPEGLGIIKHDWFNYSISKKHKNVLIIGNPPFGFRNELSKSFIKHSISFDNVTTIAFVLPNSFNKPTNQNVFPKNWKLVKSIELPKESFTFDGKSYNVPCTFYIWTKSKSEINLRFNIEKYSKHNDFEFSTRENADFYIIGTNPKNIKSLDDVESKNRGYYIKSLLNVEKLKERFLNIKWSESGNSSVRGGLSWFSKAEIIKIYTVNY